MSYGFACHIYLVRIGLFLSIIIHFHASDLICYDAQYSLQFANYRKDLFWDHPVFARDAS